MKIIIFAGGAGTRLWPISRKNLPKQFEKLKGNKSTLALAIERVQGFGLKNIFISTNEKYVKLVKKEIPRLPSKNIFSEPAKRDLAAAVGLTLLRLKQSGYTGPVVVLWADHFMDNPEAFKKALKQGEKLIEENSERMVFLGEHPRFANQNLGWIHLGNKIKDNEHRFLGWKYRPELKQCGQMFKSGKWLWNPGYFIFDLDFVLSLYKRFKPQLYKSLLDIVGNQKKIKAEYGKLESMSFDNAILEKLRPEQAVVLKVNLGWSDPGTLYALKEALTKDIKENFQKGQVFLHQSTDCFVFNADKNKLVAGVGLEGMMVINTKDALLVCHKDQVPQIKELLKEMEVRGLSGYL